MNLLAIEATLTAILVVVFLVMRQRKRKAADAPASRSRGAAPAAPGGFAADLSYGLSRMRSRVGFRRVEVQDHTFAYLDGGDEGEETVLLLHGFGGEKDDWLGVAARLRKRFRVVIPDLPGSGDSSRSSQARYDVVTQARRIRAFCHKVRVDRCHVVGSYTGGAIAGIYASVFPDEARSLVLVESFGVEPINPAEVDRIAANGGNPFADYGRAEKLQLPRGARSAHSRERVRRRGVGDAMWRDIMGQRPYLLQAVGSEIKVPTLLVWGDSNKVVHLAAQRVLETAIPIARSVVMKGGAHLLMLDRPAELAKEIEKFIDAVNLGTAKPQARA